MIPRGDNHIIKSSSVSLIKTAPQAELIRFLTLEVKLRESAGKHMISWQVKTKPK